MPRKQNSFAIALAAATKRMAKAMEELQAAREKMRLLDAEIPNLQRTIAALQQQLGGSPKLDKLPEFVHKPIPGIINELMASNVDGTPLTEDDLLPDPDGTPVAGE